MVLYIHFFIIISLKVFTFVDQSTNLSVHIQIPTRANTQNITGWMVCRETPICLLDKAFALQELVNFCNVKSSKMLTVQKDLTICPIIIRLQWTRKTN